MPSFDLVILFWQLALFNVLGGCVAMFAAGLPAFAVASAPEHLDYRARAIGLSLVGILMLGGLVLWWVDHAAWPALRAAIGIVAFSTLIGFGARASVEVRRVWLPIGVVMALALGAIIFATGHYGQNNCWP